jgi:transposase
MRVKPQIKDIRKIIVFLNEQEMQVTQVATLFQVSRDTIYRWIKLLREAGHEVNTRGRARPKIRVESAPLSWMSERKRPRL